MTTQQLMMAVPMLAAMCVAAGIDGSTRRIPNWLTLPMLAAGLLQSFLPGHVAGPWDSFLGLLTGFALTFILFAMGAMGGGDVKMMTAIGAWVGPETVFYIYLAERVIGMLIVLGQALQQKRLRVLARNTAVVAMNFAHVSDVGMDHVQSTGKAARSVDRPLPMAIPSLIATVLVLGLKWVGGL